ncbi:integrin beta-like protein 1 [Alligator sinensis]|uniref:Integrin beta-like protein 1 n=1 Tax=Alligator sinensis TaxID=38654 RepID=A0A3Q0FUG4_ALLSI|nr:integrin beta-like protein 1 [Alligator sinensis]
MYAQGILKLVLLLAASLLSLLPALPPTFSLSLRSASTSASSCQLSQAESELRCHTSGGKLCNGRGQCNCGVCICRVTEPGKYYGPLCECHDWVCDTYDGKICADSEDFL